MSSVNWHVDLVYEQMTNTEKMLVTLDQRSRGKTMHAIEIAKLTGGMILCGSKEQAKHLRDTYGVDARTCFPEKKQTISKWYDELEEFSK